jgi:2-succinyl-6-hydroxy-2,4-cyclohexadiene-1-carboxylate synthase
MPYATVNELRYSYESVGSGEPLVLLHGFTGSSQSWDEQVPFFARQHRTITIDLIGHGKSASPADAMRYSMAQVAQDVMALLQEIVSEPVNLLGYSMGGRLALYLACIQTSLVKRLILESASPGLDSQVERQDRINQDEELAESIIRGGVSAFVTRWERMPIFGSQKRLPEAARARLRRQRLRNDAIGLANSLRGMGTGAQPSLWVELPKLELPVLLLAGELDYKFVSLARQMSSSLPFACVEIIPGAGHTIHLEKPEQFNQSVGSFLNGTDCNGK